MLLQISSSYECFAHTLHLCCSKSGCGTHGGSKFPTCLKAFLHETFEFPLIILNMKIPCYGSLCKSVPYTEKQLSAFETIMMFYYSKPNNIYCNQCDNFLHHIQSSTIIKAIYPSTHLYQI